MRGKRRSWTDEQFIAAVAVHTSFSEVLRALGPRPAGGNHRTMRKHAARLGVSTAHFSDERQLRALRFARERLALPLGTVFCARSRVFGRSLRKYASRHLPAARCALCGLTEHWNGMPLTLQLDHANGVYDDNRLENLRWLCPNCHSQTATFAGKGKRRATTALQRA